MDRFLCCVRCNPDCHNMKNTHLYLLFFFPILLSSCLKLEEDKKYLSFWTAQNLVEETVLYINDNPVGKMTTSESIPDCADLTIVRVPLDNTDDMKLTIKNATEGLWDIGVINLYSVANGLSIKPETDSSIFVTQGLDDMCTMIELKW